MGATSGQHNMMYEKYSKLRDEKGVTDYEVSKNTGVSTPTLTSWKQGKYTPKIDKITQIANYFGVEVGYFL